MQKKESVNYQVAYFFLGPKIGQYWMKASVSMNKRQRNVASVIVLVKDTGDIMTLNYGMLH